MAHASKGKSIPLPWTINLSTGKGSMHQTGFNDVAWGKATCSYAKLAGLLANVKFNAIIEDAKEFLKPSWSCNKTMEAIEIIDIDNDDSDDNDEWVHLVDNSDDSEID